MREREKEREKMLSNKTIKKNYRIQKFTQKDHLCFYTLIMQKENQENNPIYDSNEKNKV